MVTFTEEILNRKLHIFQPCKGLYELITEAIVRRCSSKSVLLKISQYSQENTCVLETLFYRTLLVVASVIISNLTLPSPDSHKVLPVEERNNNLFFRR